MCTYRMNAHAHHLTAADTDPFQKKLEYQGKVH